MPIVMKMRVAEEGEEVDNGRKMPVIVTRSSRQRQAGPWVPMTYMCVVDDSHDTRQYVTSVNRGTILCLTLFYIKDVVLIPESILPLAIIEKVYTSAVRRARGQVDSPSTIGVVRAYRDPETGRMRSAAVGTTFEIRGYIRFDDGSVRMKILGKQRFYVRRQWRDVKGKSCGEVEVIEDEMPVRPPREAFGYLPPLSNVNHPRLPSSPKPCLQFRHPDEDDSVLSEMIGIFVSEPSSSKTSSNQPAVEEESCSEYVGTNDSEPVSPVRKCQRSDRLTSPTHPARLLAGSEGSSKSTITRNGNVARRLTQFRAVPRAFLPYWVYQMNDPFYLAKKAADIWNKVVVTPNMDDFVSKPDILSFKIAGKIPTSVSTRQELLEINGVSKRLRRLIQLLERFDIMRCKQCKTVICRRSDEVIIGDHDSHSSFLHPIYENPMSILYKADGLTPVNEPSIECDLFPGYSRTRARCSTCNAELGYVFNAINPELKPKYFWCVHRFCIEDDKL